MDTIREQLVKRPFTRSDRHKQLAITALSFVLGIAALILMLSVFGGMYFLVGVALGLLFAGGILYLGYRLVGNLHVEYEYCVAGTEITVDKIIDQKRRKHLVDVNLKSAMAIYPYQRDTQDVQVFSAIGKGDIYTLEFTDPKYGRSCLYFSPDERTLDMISVYVIRMSS